MGFLCFSQAQNENFQNDPTKDEKIFCSKIATQQAEMSATTNYCKLDVEFQTQYKESGYYNMVQLT